MKLKELFKDYRGGMSQFQDDYFVTIKNGLTPYGQYMQALKELYSRFNGLKSSWIELRKLDLVILELEQTIEKMSREVNEIEYERKIIDLEVSLMAKDELERQIQEAKIEFDRFYRQAVYLKGFIGDLTKERAHELEKEYWFYRILELAHVDQITTGSIRQGTYEMIMSIPLEMRKRVLKSITNKEQLANWYHDFDKTATLPEEELDKIPSMDKEKIIATKVDFKHLLEQN